MKWHISVDHRLVGTKDTSYDTSGHVELTSDRELGQAINEFVRAAVRQGHEVVALRCYRADDEAEGVSV